MAQMITEDLVRLDADLGTDKHDVIRALARIVDDAGRATDADQLAEDALAREATAATGLNGGIAIPHCRSTGVETPTLAFARLSPGVEFGAKDGPADLAFLIAAPAGGDASHLKLLAKLARALVKKEFTDSLRAATTPAQVVALVSGVVGDEPPAAAPVAAAPAEAAPAAAASTPSASGPRSLVAVTACPTGIAHTYMAAEALEAAAAKAGVADPGRDAGLGRVHPALPRGHRGRVRRDLRRRRRGPRPAAVRRQARRLVRRQAPDRRRRRDDRRGAPLRRRPQRTAGRGRGVGRRGVRRQRVVRQHAPAGS